MNTKIDISNITPQMKEMARLELIRRGVIKNNEVDIPVPRKETSTPIVKSQDKSSTNIFDDIGESAGNLLMGIGNKAMNLPGEAQEALSAMAEKPAATAFRGPAGVLSSLLEGGKSLYNLPLQLNTYLGSKGVPLFKQTSALAEKLKIGDTGLKKAILGDEKKGDEFFEDLGNILPMIFSPGMAPKIAGRSLAVTSKGITKALQKEKDALLSNAKQEYGDLFDIAKYRGVSHVGPTDKIIKNKNVIIENSSSKFNKSLQKYLENPTLENAHWAQSELGSFKRHLEKIEGKQGLTPTQVQALKATKDVQKEIQENMFSKNSLGAHKDLADTYKDISANYKKKVIPYTSLEELPQVASKELKPSNAIKSLLKDDKFMLELGKRYPGIFLHTKPVKHAAAALGLGSLFGYNEIKKLLTGN